MLAATKTGERQLTNLTKKLGMIAKLHLKIYNFLIVMKCRFQDVHISVVQLGNLNGDPRTRAVMFSGARLVQQFRTSKLQQTLFLKIRHSVS